jgi:hypothetical protein
LPRRRIARTLLFGAEHALGEDDLGWINAHQEQIISAAGEIAGCDDDVAVRLRHAVADASGDCARRRIIIPHAGAALPVLASRIDLFASARAGNGAEVPSLRAALKNMHFDLAGAPVNEQLAALLSVAGPTRLHYDSDFPFTPRQACQYLARQLENLGAARRRGARRDIQCPLRACSVNPRHRHLRQSDCLPPGIRDFPLAPLRAACWRGCVP